MAYIVFIEKRPFSHIDFREFEVEGSRYKMAYGTFRNKISKLRRIGEVEVDYNSTNTYYTLPGQRFGKNKTKSMTRDHRVVRNDPFCTMLRNLPLGKQGIHNVRIKFHAVGIWKLCSDQKKYYTIKRSNDIVIPSWNLDNVIVKVVFHKTDVVSIILGCSINPIPLDIEGVLFFIGILVRIEERLKMDVISSQFEGDNSVKIPNYKRWILTMWHFGRDALDIYKGEKFSITIEKAENILLNVYAKKFKPRFKVRYDRQEYPRQYIEEILDARLGHLTMAGQDKLVSTC